MNQIFRFCFLGVFNTPDSNRLESPKMLKLENWVYWTFQKNLQIWSWLKRIRLKYSLIKKNQQQNQIYIHQHLPISQVVLLLDSLPHPSKHKREENSSEQWTSSYLSLSLSLFTFPHCCCCRYCWSAKYSLVLVVELVVLHPPRLAVCFSTACFPFFFAYTMLFHSEEGGGGFFAYCVFALLLSTGGRRRIITARFLLEKRGSHRIFPFSGTIVREYEILLDYVAGWLGKSLFTGNSQVHCDNFPPSIGKRVFLLEKNTATFLFARLFIR